MRLVICEDSVLLREGLVRLLAEAGHEVVAVVGDVPALLDAAGRCRPDLVLLDVRLPPTHRDEGMTAALRLRRDLPGLPILVLSHYVEPAYARDLLRTGSSGIGYLLKDRVGRVEAFLAAVDDVAGGATVLDPQVVDQVLTPEPTTRLRDLTPRERQVLALMADGRSNTDIAAQLVLSRAAVEKYVGRILAKLDLRPSDRNDRRVLAVLAYLQSTDP